MRETRILPRRKGYLLLCVLGCLFVFFVKTEKDEKGNTVHIYKKIAPVPKVETRYVDENGNQLLPPKEGTQNQVNIDGYDYVSTNKDNNGNTIHVYKKKVITPDVVTKYVDENGNEIESFIINSPNTIRKDPFFYRCDGDLCFDFLKELEEKYSS